MELVIVICLVIVIVLLLQDKIVIKIGVEHKPEQKKNNSKLPDVMGQPKTLRSLSVSMAANESQNKKQEQRTDNFDVEIEDQDIDRQIPQEELDEVSGNLPDFEDEEEEWITYGISDGDNGFAQGVTFEELNSVGGLLQKDKLEPDQKKRVVAIVKKIQGTELFDLLENSMESASQKIAELLDNSLSSDTETGSSVLRKNDFEDFDIGEFV